MSDDVIVTNRDIYTLVQQANARTTQVMHQVDNLATQNQEYRQEAEDQAREIIRIKARSYGVMATVTVLAGIAVILGQVSAVSTR